MMTVDEMITDYIRRWEGGLSLDPNDNGNWTGAKKGVGKLVGSNCGVTARTLAAYRGVKVDAITAADIKAITLPVAADIAKKLFYVAPGLANLPWNRVTASVLDFGWGAGPAGGVMQLQDMLDVAQDGKIGPNGQTATALWAFVKARGEECAAGAWWAMREEYYEDLVARRPSDGIYLKGWDNRSAYYLPGTPWWQRWG